MLLAHTQKAKWVEENNTWTNWCIFPNKFLAKAAKEFNEESVVHLINGGGGN